MRVAVSGASGFIGVELCAALEKTGHDVVRLVRSGPFARDRVFWDPVPSGTIDVFGLAGVNAVVHLAGEPIGIRRWTSEQKRKILTSREQGTAVIAGAIAGMNPRPAILISASAVGYYGDRGDEVLTEGSGSGGGFLAEVVRRWEAATVPAEKAGIRVATIRTGLVLGASGGLLKRMKLPFRMGLGARLGSGNQWMSWISMRDEIGAILHILEGEGSGPFNLTAPVPVTGRAFTASLASALGRKAPFVVPRAAMSAALGSELTADLLASQRALPAKLESSGYVFRDLDLGSALLSVLSHPTDHAR